MSYTDIKVKFLQELVAKFGRDWQTIATEYNTEFDDNKTANAIRKTHKRYENVDIDDDSMLKSLEKARKAEVQNTRLKKTQKVILDKHIEFGEVLVKIEHLIKNGTFAKFNPPKVLKSKDKHDMIIEPLISDIHYGLRTKSYDTLKARERVARVAQVALEEMHRYSKIYNIEKFNLLLNGDLMQSATMHKDSHASCELSNAEQLAIAIQSLYEDLIAPIAATGHVVDVIAMCGNHDRESFDRYTVNPGKYYYTYTVYKSLELICKKSGLKNVNFLIPTEGYHVYEIFGSHFLLEHGDLVGKLTMKSLETQINNRSVQVDKLIKGIRIGHFHNDIIGSMGRYICNGSPVSDDHYGDGLGYKSRPCQLINYYVKTERDNPYYHTLVVSL